MDSCYLCEIEHEGMQVPFQGQTILLCFKCLLDCVYRHPKLALAKGNAA